MTETGWPLIPREVLPAPVPAAARRPAHPKADPPPDTGRQLPFFGAETIEPSPGDLAGLLAGPGELGRMGGTARVAVPVDAAWRVHVLVAELVIRGLVVNWRPLDEQEASDVRDVVYAPLEEDAIPDIDDAVDTTPDEAPPAASETLRLSDKSEISGNRIRGRVRDRDVSGSVGGGSSGNSSVSSTGADEGLGGGERPGGADRRSAGGERLGGGDGGSATGEGSGSGEGSGGADRGSAGGEGLGGGDGRSGAADHEPGEGESQADGPRFEVRTAYSRRLNGLAQAWPRAAAQLFLSGPRLRLWVAAAGEPVPGGYALGLDPGKDVTEIDAALVRAGLGGRVSEDGRRYLIMGKRRVARLAELVGERPAAAPERLWPGGAAA